ncbi:MAG TPA: 4-(cytidine 5'-diphospho)-2-C-methyl-D-erythritol kinase [Candidatus Binatia bacterium]|nr:4-(cytidine 5'-diphospho)-2-C-methyl-D-erythritol kinase [Candidatus Binatia bacterium]
MLRSGSIDAPGKINLTLEILERANDGFHRLRSVMAPIGVWDRITWTPSKRFAFRSGDPALGSDNLVERALRAIGLGDAPLEVVLHKEIPVGGGLGGGSSDAAAILRAAMRGAFGEISRSDWIAVARALGSDVPFFLIDGPALVEGSGERLTALGAPPPWWVCLAVPAIAVDTGDAYKRLDASRGRASERAARAESSSVRLGEALQRHDFDATQALLCNDFEPVIAAAYPPVARALDALRAAGAPRPMLSGSGACVFALCETEPDARGLIGRLQGTERALAVPFASSTAWIAAR